MKTVPPGKGTLKPLGANGFKYRQQYGIVVLCRDETDQANRYQQLKALGLALRVVAV